ncbi:MAG: GAF domain-containing protein [Chloroflexi bacterium]|nr:GAF domain-containing protein [Chloroflexota bacterium]
MAGISESSRRQRALNQLAAVVQESVDETAIVARVAAGLGELGLGSVLALFGREPADLVVRSVAHLPQLRVTSLGALEPGGRLSLDASPALARAVATGEAQLGPLTETGDRSGLLGAPLSARGQRLGLLVVFGAGFTRADRESVATFATHVAIALDNVRLRLQGERRAARLEELHQLTAEAAGATDPHRLARIVVERSSRLLGTGHATVWALNSTQDELRNLASYGLRPPSQGSRRRLDQGVGARAIRERRTIVADDYSRDPDAMPDAIERGVYAIIAAPLLIGDRVLGTFQVQSHEPRVWTPEDIQLVELLAQQVAVALEQTRLLSEAQRRADQLQKLHEVALRFAVEPEERSLLRAVIEAAALLLGSNDGRIYGRIWLYEPVSHEVVCAAIAGNAFFPVGTRRSADIGATGVTLRERRTVALSSYANWPGAVPEYRTLGTGASLTVPLLTVDVPLGVLSLDDREAHDWLPADVALVELLAQQATAAIVNARRRAAEQEAARLDGVLRLANTATHELNNPLAVVAGYAELLGTLDDPERIKGYASKIRVASLELAERTRRLGNVTRITDNPVFPGQGLLDIESSR